MSSGNLMQLTSKLNAIIVKFPRNLRIFLMSNLFLFTGNDTFTAHKTLKFWQDEFTKKYGDYNVQVYEGEDLSVDEFRNAIGTMPFLSDKKLVIIRDFLDSASNEEQQKVAEILEQLGDHCVLVFIEHESPDARTSLYKKIAKIGQIKNFPELEPAGLVDWISKEVNKKSIHLGQKELTHLSLSVGPNLWQMSHELEKISLFANAQPSTNITAATIDLLISPNLSSNIFKLTDSIAAKNPKAAIKILDTLLQSGDDLFQIFYMIARQFRLLLQIKTCLLQKLSTQKIIQKLKEKPFTVNQTVNQCQNFTVPQLQLAYKELLNIDINLKTGKIRTTTDDNREFRLSLEKLIIKLCR